jgi:hypothetical protein
MGEIVFANAEERRVWLAAFDAECRSMPSERAIRRADVATYAFRKRVIGPTESLEKASSFDSLQDSDT